jgi:hypothetical protein
MEHSAKNGGNLFDRRHEKGGNNAANTRKTTTTLAETIHFQAETEQRVNPNASLKHRSSESSEGEGPGFQMKISAPRKNSSQMAKS